MMEKKRWIYQLRAISVIGAVICHQQFLLHTSEWIQFGTLYCVTVMILLSGVTNTIWIKKNSALFRENKILYIMSRKLFPVVSLYIVASIMYLVSAGEFVTVSTGIDPSNWTVVWENLLNFSASSPFYFIEYYIALSFAGLLIYSIVSRSDQLEIYSTFIKIMIFIFSFVVGYLLMEKAHFLGGSYLGVYTLGIIWGNSGANLSKHRNNIFIGSILLIIGIYSSKIFYWNRVAGKHEPYGIDILVPKLSLNPPNISVILYAIGVIIVFGHLFDYLNSKTDNPFLQKLLMIVEIIGKYSLDIFIWHLLIQGQLRKYLMVQNILLRNVIWYLAMIGIPIIIRLAYQRIVKEIYIELQKDK